ncbi:craniofacial development protein 1 isoform X1 [Hordeum vulgare subsp. vulgare]|uniref:BCNT-C domain-containing protein n=3 Tax=Hordeum vulgare subsp. vulgare TaxID=112509 RepID=A0A8I6Y3A9_HORVV|nr:craniofacial development protein 1 isoform X1 [Hordeum vulgare subsp. vulgare]XP_044958610.1 craniofacial development protein 1 isoform X1 [Hordeum vulgare subsp. vulgare]
MDADETLPASGDANNSEQQPHDTDKKSRVEDMWKKMNSGLPAKMPKPAMVKLKTAAKEKKTKATNNNWMTILGLPPKKVSANDQVPKNEQQQTQQKTSEDTKKLAANALAAVKDAATAASGRGKVEITEVRDFAGKDIEIKKLVDADSKEAVEKASAVGAAPSAVDNILEQIRKKQKLSVLDKTKKDWGEYKVEKGVEEELGAYKKSSNQYLDRQSFLKRADYREYELERDARLSLMAKRKSESMQDDDA